MKPGGQGERKRNSSCRPDADSNHPPPIPKATHRFSLTPVKVPVTSSPEIEVPSDPAIRHLGIYPERVETLIQEDTHTPVFIAALFTIAKSRKHHTCPSRDGWMKTWQTQTHHSAIKSNETVPSAATRAGPEILTLSDARQTEASVGSLACGILKNDTKKSIYQTDSDIENNLILPKGKG